MLRSDQALRLVRTGQAARLADMVLRNGRPIPDAARRRLLREATPASAPAAAMGLALTRLCELRRAADDGMLDLGDALLGLMDESGGFGTAPATAAAAAGLLALGRLLGPGHPGSEGLLAAGRRACAWAAGRMGEMVERESAVGGAPGGRAADRDSSDALDAALALWLLGETRGVLASADAARARAALEARRADAATAAVLALAAPARRSGSLAA